MTKTYAKDKRENFFEKLYHLLLRQKWIVHGPLGYCIAVVVEIVNSIPENGIIIAVLDNILIGRKTSNLVFYIAISIIFIYQLSIFFLKRYLKNKTVDNRLRDIYAKYTDKIFIGHETEGLSWGLCQTVMSAPNLREGWKTEAITFEIDNNLFSFQILKKLDPSLNHRDLNTEYIDYLEKEFSKKYKIDSDRLMLQEKPIAMTDHNALCIKLKKVKWSQLQFMWTKLLTEDFKKLSINYLFNNKNIIHPNSLCLHLIVKTSDGKILITENSINKENDYAKSWAVSIGEQIDNEDIKNIDDDCAYYWVKRALNEELCIDEKDFDKKGISFLSLNLEGDLINFALACIVEVFIDSENLKNRLFNESRIDNEFKNIDFIEINDIPKELVNSSREYHPSSKIRMIYTYLFTKGPSQLRYQLLKNEYL